MGLEVPAIRRNPSVATVLNGLPVRERSIREMCELQNWIAGFGATQIPAYCPNVTLSAATEYVFQWRIQPRYQTFDRYWAFRFRGSTAVGTFALEIPNATSVATGIGFGTDRNAISNFTIVKELASQSSSTENATVAITPTTANMVVEEIAMYEVPRARLASGGSDRGMDTSQNHIHGPIQHSRLSPLFSSTDSFSEIGQRCSLVQWAVPHLAGGASTTSFAATFSGTAAFTVGALSANAAQAWANNGICVLGRFDQAAATAANLAASCIAWKSGAGNGSIRLFTTSGLETATTTITATTPTVTTLTAPSIDRDDLTASTGLRRAIPGDRLQLEGRVTAGATVLYVASFSLVES